MKKYDIKVLSRMNELCVMSEEFKGDFNKLIEALQPGNQENFPDVIQEISRIIRECSDEQFDDFAQKFRAKLEKEEKRQDYSDNIKILMRGYIAYWQFYFSDTIDNEKRMVLEKALNLFPSDEFLAVYFNQMYEEDMSNIPAESLEDMLGEDGNLNGIPKQEESSKTPEPEVK